MKSLIRNIIALLVIASFTVSAKALDMYFSVTQNTGTWVEVQTSGDPSDVGYGFTGNATAPGHALWAFHNYGASADIRAAVDSTYSKTTHYIGYFSGGGNCYLTIN